MKLIMYIYALRSVVNKDAWEIVDILTAYLFINSNEEEKKKYIL